MWCSKRINLYGVLFPKLSLASVRHLLVGLIWDMKQFRMTFGWIISVLRLYSWYAVGDKILFDLNVINKYATVALFQGFAISNIRTACIMT
jgi:hypothetical protein